MSGDHTYQATLSWAGTTADGYERYDREHRVECPPSGDVLRLSADPAFRGDPARLNPEQLLVAAASSCQLLSFLAIAARSGVEVAAYEDEATGVMPADADPERITEIVLRPRITIASDVPEARVLRIVEKAHEECYIANSLRTEITVQPTIVVRPAVA